MNVIRSENTSRIVFFLLFMVVLVHLKANIFYIDNNGNNANSGTSGNPWLTLSYPLTNATEGGAIFINPGTYEIDASLEVPVGVSLMGAGKSSVKLSNVTTQYAASLRLASGNQKKFIVNS